MQTIRCTLNLYFLSKIDRAPYKPVRLMYGSDSALLFTVHLKPAPVQLFFKQTAVYAINYRKSNWLLRYSLGSFFLLLTAQLRPSYIELSKVTRYFFRTVASYRSVHLMYEKKTIKAIFDNVIML